MQTIPIPQDRTKSNQPRDRETAPGAGEDQREAWPDGKRVAPSPDAGSHRGLAQRVGRQGGQRRHDGGGGRDRPGARERRRGDRGPLRVGESGRSNRQRNAWVVALLEVQAGDRVLEIGFGPGVAIAELSRRVGPSGSVCGVDHSDVMLRQATKRNAAAVQAGQVTLARGGVEQLPPGLGGPFDAVLAVNPLGFWTAPAERLRDLRRRLRPGGRIAIASQPRGQRARTSTSLEIACEITDLCQAAGFTDTRTETLDLAPPVVCVLAVTQGPTLGEDA